MVDSPLLADWSGPLTLPDFAGFDPTLAETAFEQAMADNLIELDAIADQVDPPTFRNTVVPFDRAGAKLEQLSRLFFNLCSAESNAALQAAQRAMSPKLAAHGSRISMHQRLFDRFDDLHQRKAELGLTEVDERLLDRFYQDFVQGGARLAGEARTRAAAIAEELASLQTTFSQNILAEESSWHLELHGEADLAGMPDWLRAAARGAAANAGLAEGSHIITLSRSLVSPFLATSTRRDLREIAWKAWIARCENNNEHDNRPLINAILILRNELAQLHGYATFADFQLKDTMAKTPGAVDSLLRRAWTPARSAALAEHETLNELARRAGEPEVEGWDWRFYSEEVRRTTYELDDNELKPYLSLDAVLGAAFDCANKLFGLRFVERPDITTYQSDVRTFEVYNAKDELHGIFLSDNFARPSKNGGAWMSTYRLRNRDIAGPAGLPIIANHNNFSKADAGSPTLLSLDDARTLFHEFGHGLHGLLSESPHARLAGTAVLRDFVELPSQLFEHWFLEPTVLRTHARHVDTGQPMPEELIDKVQKAAHFNQGFETVEFVSCALVDLALHQKTDLAGLDLNEFERDTLSELGMPAAMAMRHRLPHFSHLFSSQYYASSYYVYLWAEVLDADAFEAFVEAGDPFDPAVADRLYTYIYSSGNTIEPGAAYRAFRGRDAAIEPMLKGRGLLTQ